MLPVRTGENKGVCVEAVVIQGLVEDRGSAGFVVADGRSEASEATETARGSVTQVVVTVKGTDGGGRGEEGGGGEGALGRDVCGGE